MRDFMRILVVLLHALSVFALWVSVGATGVSAQCDGASLLVPVGLALVAILDMALLILMADRVYSKWQ